jgi:hypothetical protein
MSTQQLERSELEGSSISNSGAVLVPSKTGFWCLNQCQRVREARFASLSRTAAGAAANSMLRWAVTAL